MCRILLRVFRGGRKACRRWATPPPSLHLSHVHAHPIITLALHCEDGGPPALTRTYPPHPLYVPHKHILYVTAVLGLNLPQFQKAEIQRRPQRCVTRTIPGRVVVETSGNRAGSSRKTTDNAHFGNSDSSEVRRESGSPDRQATQLGHCKTVRTRLYDN